MVVDDSDVDGDVENDDVGDDDDNNNDDHNTDGIWDLDNWWFRLLTSSNLKHDRKIYYHLQH